MRLLVAFFALLHTPAPAAAQWLVVPVGSGEPTAETREAATAMRVALEAAGTTVLADETSAASAASLLSRERAVVAADRIDELVDAVRVLEEQVALRHREAALEAAERVRALSTGVAEALAEQREIAQRLFDACVAEAWLHIQLGEAEAARADLRRCRESYPDIVVDPHAMSAQVYDLVVEIDAELAARPAFQIEVVGVPDGCEMTLDGRRRATSPAPIEGVFAGEHRLEVECPGMRRLRIHSVLLGAADLRLELDVRFDDALRTAGGLWLDYATVADATANRIADVRTLGQALGASDVVVVTLGATSVRLDRVSVESGRLTGTTNLELPVTESGAEAAANALLEGRGAAAGDGGGTSGPGVDGALLAGVVLAGVGIASIGAAWGTYAWRYDLGERVYQVAPGTPEHASRLSARDGATPVPFALGTIGSLAATVSLPLWLPETGEFPWWSAIPGVAGAALIGVGIYQYTGDGRCVDLRNGCIQTYSTTLSGTLWLESGAPLLAVPIVYLFRTLLGPSVAATASVDLGADHAVLTVGGRL